MSEEKFEAWAIIELFGHARLAGKVSEAQIGGCAFVRVDVPGDHEAFKFTKFLGNGAIYAINLVSEEIARTVANQIRAKPTYAYELEHSQIMPTHTLEPPNDE
jgi:hypothetical protein